MKDAPVREPAPLRAEIRRIVVEKKRENPATGELETYERVEINFDEIADASH